MTNKELVENMLAASVLQLQVLLEMRSLIARQSDEPTTSFEFKLADVSDHICMQRRQIINLLEQQPD